MYWGFDLQMTRFSTRARQPGFTLVELLVTVAVLAVIIGLAVPSFRGVMQRNRLTTAANEFVATLQLARMEAVRRNLRAVVCPTSTGTGCGGADWSRVVVFVDRNSNGAVDAAETVVKDVQVAKPDSGISVVGDAVVASNHRIWFGADGRVRVGAAAGNVGAVSVSAPSLPSAERTRRVNVSTSRISVCKPSSPTSTCS